MSGFLLDTNVVSEATRAVPDPRVAAFLAERDDLWLPTIVLHEMEFGIQVLPHGRRRDDLQAMTSGIIAEHRERILPLERDAAERAAIFRVHARREGRTLSLADALIAGTAAAYDLAVATRNVGDFAGLGVDVHNPWERP